MKITREYTFTPFERTILKERILGRITEADCGKKLGVPRQYVNDYVARLVIQEQKNGSFNVC